MIAVDTSALMAILLDEPHAERCKSVLKSAARVVMSAATLAETLIVASRRDLKVEMTALIEELGFDIVAVTPPLARRTAAAYERWGKGVHPAKYLGDCFAYAVAEEYDCPLLFVGNDFAQTDVKRSA